MTLPHVTEDTYHSVRDYPVEEYRCGAKAGDRVRLRRDIGVHPVGQIWSVLRGAAEEAVVVWLRQADGERIRGATMKTFLQRLRSCHAMPSNHAMERTADRCTLHFEMTSALPPRATRGLVRRRSS